MRQNKLFALSFLFIILASSCATSKKRDDDTKTRAPEDEISIAEKASLESAEFIFIRLYDVKYLPKNFGWNALKILIKTQGNAPNGKNYTHSAVNLSLDDDFVGITGCKGYDANRESVVELSTTYLQKLDREKSICTVIAVPCTKTDKENCKILLDYVLDPSAEIKFSVGDVAKMPFPHGKNKKNIKNAVNDANYTKESEELSKAPDEIFEEKKYSCSVFISKVMYNSIAWFNEYVDSLNLSLEGFTPNDFYDMFGTSLLFSCPFSEYDKTVQKFRTENPIFAKY